MDGIRYVNQQKNPLNMMFFSQFNISIIQKDIIDTFKRKTNITIGNQNPDDIITIMTAVYINNSREGFNHIKEQVNFMNSIVVKTAISQIGSSITQYMNYLRDITATGSQVMELPKNTKMTGMRTTFTGGI